jgi:hypothetical protein
MAGLISLYDPFDNISQEDMQKLMVVGDRKRLSSEFAYYIRPDSTVLLDANQRIDKLMKYLNLVGKSGFVNPKSIIEEITELHDLDPATTIIDPEPPKDEPPKMSFAFKGEDMINPIAVALVLNGGKPPTPEDIQAAIKLIHTAQTAMPEPPVPVTGEMGGPMQADSVDPSQADDVRPGWTPPARVTKRLDEMGG